MVELKEENRNQPATERQLRYIKYLVSNVEITRGQASTFIDLLKAENDVESSVGSEVS